MGELNARTLEFDNAPPSTVIPDPNLVEFEHLTEENIVPIANVSIDGGNHNLGQLLPRIQFKKRGLTKKMLVRASAEFTVDATGGTVKATDIWPYGLLRWLDFHGNGMMVHHVSGWMMHVYHVRRNQGDHLADLVYDEVSEQFAAGASITSGTYKVELTYEIPLCYDYKHGVGSIYAETDAAEFSLEPQLASLAELFAITGTASVTFGGLELSPTMVFFELKRVNIGNGQQVMYVPDLSRLFQLQERSKPITHVGDNEALAMETRGNLVSADCVFRNNGKSVYIGQGGLDYVGWGYGANLQPRLYRPTEHLLYENRRLHKEALPYNAFALDFDTENARRDSTRPKDAAEMGVRFGIPRTSTLVDARFHMLNEQLVATGDPHAVAV